MDPKLFIVKPLASVQCLASRRQRFSTSNQKSLTQLISLNSCKYNTLGHKIFGKLMVLCKHCINLCSEMCFLGQIPTAIWELFSEQVICFLVSFTTRFLKIWNPNLSPIPLIFGISPLVVLKTLKRSHTKNIGNRFQDFILENGYHVKYKSKDHFGEKKDAWNWSGGEKINLNICLSGLQSPPLNW